MFYLGVSTYSQYSWLLLIIQNKITSQIIDFMTGPLHRWLYIAVISQPRMLQICCKHCTMYCFCCRVQFNPTNCTASLIWFLIFEGFCFFVVIVVVELFYIRFSWQLEIHNPTRFIQSMVPFLNFILTYINLFLKLVINFMGIYNIE